MFSGRPFPETGGYPLKVMKVLRGVYKKSPGVEKFPERLRKFPVLPPEIPCSVE
jgi:hypothetical protein